MLTLRFITLIAAASISYGLPAPALAKQVVTGDGRTIEQIRQSVPNIDTVRLKAELEKNPDLVLIDVRTVRETQLTGGTIKAKRNMIIPRGWLEFRIADAAPDKMTPVVVYCGTNRRSPLALQKLVELGYKNVRNYADGFPGWREAGLPVEMADAAPDSFLYSLPQKVVDGVWSAIGQTAPSTYQNSGHNNNLSFIVTDEGVVVFNAGGSYLLARSLHDEIKKVTSNPVKYVVLENGQGHAALGSGYWREQGVPIIAHEAAVHELDTRREEIVASAKQRLRDKFFATRLIMPDETFSEKKVIELGGVRIELLYLGPAHSPGDIMAWLPQEGLIISGDMAFHQRLLPVFEHTDTAAWVETWEKFAALGAGIVIPGHGGPTTMAEVTKYTRDYLVYMRAAVGNIIEEMGDLSEAYQVDQSAYEHLDTFEFLARRNAGRIFQSMEFE